jgi:hypothetical protein
MALGGPSVSDDSRRLCVADILVSVRAGIRDRTTSFIVSENSWPIFMYENYEADAKNLECGLMKSKLLIMVSDLILPADSQLIISQGFKAIFTSPSSANEVDGDGDGADIIENCRHAVLLLKGLTNNARIMTTQLYGIRLLASP